MVSFLLPWCLLSAQTLQDKKSLWKWEARLNSLFSATMQKYNDTEVNYLNQVLKKPDMMGQLELQPRVELKSTWIPIKWQVKPKLKIRQSQYVFSNQSLYQGVSEYGFWENYLSLQLGSRWEASIGIMNTQWGPSEFLNPSQFFIFQQTLNTEPFQMVQGLEMAQILWTPSQNLTFNLIQELKPFQWEHSDELESHKQGTRFFYDRSILRGEYSSPSGGLVLAQVVGQKKSDQTRFQYGGYALWNYSDWTQIYVDYLTQRGSETEYYTGTQLIRSYEDSDYVFFLGLLGHRWTFDSGLEWKVEWVTNSFGKTKEEREFEIRALKQNPGNILALQAYYSRNYILPGQNYIYNSLRWDNSKWLASLFVASSIYLRNLSSISDSSQFWNLEIQTDLNAHWSQAIAVVKTYSQEQGELNLELDYFVSYVLKWAF